MSAFWKKLETAPSGQTLSAADALDALRWNADGLLPVIAQDADSGRVLMLAWANREALEMTLESGWMVYYSRSRGCLWRKGETSGHTQRLHSLRIDCDGDALLAKVRQNGAACHTNRTSCFYIRIDGDGRTVIIDNDEAGRD